MQPMEQIAPKYNFRRRDYVRIKNWYDFAKMHYVPHPPSQLTNIKNQKESEWHYRIIFDSLELTEQFVNNNMKHLLQLKQLTFMNSLYHRQSDCIVSSGKQITVGCQFDIANLSIKCSEQLIFYFYLTVSSPKDYEFCLEIQMVNSEGEILRFGFSKLALMLRKDTPKKSVFLVFNNKQMDRKLMEEIQTISQVKASRKQETESSDTFVAKVQFELDTEQIKQMKRYLPSYKIINKNSKLPPTNFNLKKKKQQITVDGSYKIVLQDLMVEISNPEQLRVQLLQSNPFTYSHKELIALKIKEYRVIIDHHNGWKSLQNNRHQSILELVVQKADKIYISSKQLPKVQINYYESDYIILFAALVCRVEFKLKGMVEESRQEDFLIGWLPLPLDLSLRQNKIELMMVNDLQFPLTINHIAHVPITISLSLLHANFQKYKAKTDDKKMFRQNILQQTNIVNSTKYTKLRSRKNNTDTLSSESNANQPLQGYLQHAREIVHSSELQHRRNSYVNVAGRCDSTQNFPTYTSTLPLQETVGKVLKVRLQIDTFIPVSDSPFDYYLPKNMQASIYFLRQKHDFPLSITQKQGRFNIPIQISNQKIKIYFKRYIDTVQEFEAIINSRFVITLYEQNSYRLYAKGIAATHDILGATEVDQIAYVTLKRWEDGVEKFCGKLLVLVNLEVQRLREGNNKVQQLQVQNVMRKLTTQQRMRLRIGNFKGDTHSKNETINLIKKKQQKEYIQKVVASEQKCDGEMYYQLGSQSYHLVRFSNEDKSQNNMFTFHLGCSYAEIVTNEQEFRSIIQKHNFESANFQRMSYYVKQPSYNSYYETKLNYNQEIGILIKLNVYEQTEKEQPLSRIELTIKRNTIQAKKMLIKCRYKQPLFGDIFHDAAIQHHSEDKDSGDVTVDLDDEMLEKYRDVEVMTKYVKYAGKQKKLMISKVAKSMKVVLLCQDKLQNRKVFILYHILFLSGRKLSVLAGKPYKLNIELQAIEEAQIIRCSDRSVKLLKTLKFHNEYENQIQDMQINILKPVKNKNIVAILYDLSGKQLSQYLFKIDSAIESVSNRSEIIIDDISIFAITFSNPYACACYFDIECSTRAVTLEETQLRLEGYAQKIVQFKVRRTQQKQIYFYLLDKRSNICQIEELTCRLIPSNLKEEQLFTK